MYCTNCGNEVGDNADVCLSCGCSLNSYAAPKYCRQCGNQLNENAVVCVKCGASTSKVSKSIIQNNTEFNIWTSFVYNMKNYSVFTGRARRKEYWNFFLFIFLASAVLGVISFGILGSVFALGVFIPGLACLVRRLHDTNRSGLYALFHLIPLVGAILLIVWCCQEGTKGENQYGADPKA